MITHGACGRSWTGASRSHCPACHETFNSDWAAEKHRTGRPGVDRRCVPPAEAGLVGVEQAWGVCWQGASGGTWFATRTEAAAA